jgi:hypothetical protein
MPAGMAAGYPLLPNAMIVSMRTVCEGEGEISSRLFAGNARICLSLALSNPSAASSDVLRPPNSRPHAQAVWFASPAQRGRCLGADMRLVSAAGVGATTGAAGTGFWVGARAAASIAA